MTIFFFISGYLFMQRDAGVSPNFVRHKARSVVRGLLLPYFLLSVVLSLPKSIVRNIALPQLMIQIVTGRAYWFVAALIVAETIFLLLLWISRGNGWKLFVLTVLSLGLLPVALRFDGGLPWHAENALLAMPFLFAGYMYRRHEEVCNHLCGWPAVLAASMAIVGVKAFDYIHSLPMCICPVNVGSWTLFFIDNAVGIVLAVAVARRLPAVGWIVWTGAHTLVYYFVCSAVPLAVSMLLNRVGLQYCGMYGNVLFAFALAYVATTFIVWVVYKPLHRLVSML